MDAQPPVASHDTLINTLLLAVPMWIYKLRSLSASSREARIVEWAPAAAGPINSCGDILQFGGGKPGEVTDVFNHLARGLAALAFQPGGVDVANAHWCVDHDACRDAAAHAAANPLPDTPTPATPPPRPIVDVHLPEVP